MDIRGVLFFVDAVGSGLVTRSKFPSLRSDDMLREAWRVLKPDGVRRWPLGA